MNTQKERRMLAAIIRVCNGREREMLDILLSNYPQPTRITDICQQLGITQDNLMYSILRNARIFINIDTIKHERKPTHLVFGKQTVTAVKCQCLCNQCFSE